MAMSRPMTEQKTDQTAEQAPGISFEELAALHQAILNLRREGKLPQAEARARELLARMPNEPNTMAVLASILMDKGQPEAAGNLLLRAREVAPLSPVTWANLGRFLQTIGRWAQAEALFELAMKNFPQEAAFVMTLGQIYQRANRFVDAENLFRRVIEMEPSHALAHMHLGMTLVRQNRAAQAVTCFNRAIELQPDFASAYGNLGNAWQQLGDMPAAEAAYEKAVGLNPGDDISQTSLGVVKLKRGASREAADIFERVLAGRSAERRAAAWFPFARAQELGQMPAGYRSELATLISRAVLTPPPGFSSMAELNKALAEALRKEPSLAFEPAGKATRKGKQTGLLLDHPRQPYLAFEQTLRKAIDAHFAGLKRVPNHPYLGMIPDSYQIALWGTLLPEGGHQYSHIHAGGWMSGVYYVELPGTLGKPDGENRDGWIEFGHPPPELDAQFEPQTVFFEPRQGEALFFPSYYFHRTVPFSGPAERVSLAFDVKPTGFR